MPSKNFYTRNMRRFFIFLCLLSFLFTCTDEYLNPVPSRRVYLEVDLKYRDKILEPLVSYKIFTAKNTINGKEFTGYAGVLVTHSIFGDYKAFDIACPYETRIDAVVEIDEDNNAICKVCGSKYDVILNGSGGCIKGPSKSPLRQYRTTLRDKTLFVNN